MPTFALITFGCQMNHHDSDRIGEVLSASGFERVSEPETADVVLLNTCSVREKAEQKLRSEVGRLGVLKRRRPDLTVAVAGCVAQQEGDALLKRMPQIDVLVGPDNIPELPTLVRNAQGGAPPTARAEFDLEAPSFLSARPAGAAAPSAFVTVMKGCDERCTFCIVPHTRGPERYRPSVEIISEIKRLVEHGTREITLLGQTVDSYLDPTAQLPTAPEWGLDRFRGRRGAGLHPDESEFPALLRAVADACPSLGRLRYTSPHPRHLTPSLIAAHRDLPVLSRHVHMPVQSGSDRLLKRMARRYTVAEYLERTDNLRAAVPGLTLSTDIIVGFPGETEEDFAATLALVERVRFVSLFGFKYSPRPYTPALKLGDDVSETEKADRLARLFELSEHLRQQHLSGLVGTEQTVLVEGEGKTGGQTGRTERNEIVHFGASKSLAGQFAQVRIVSAFKHSLEGELTDASVRAPLAPTKPQRALPVV